LRRASITTSRVWICSWGSRRKMKGCRRGRSSGGFRVNFKMLGSNHHGELRALEPGNSGIYKLRRQVRLSSLGVKAQWSYLGQHTPYKGLLPFFLFSPKIIQVMPAHITLSHNLNKGEVLSEVSFLSMRRNNNTQPMHLTPKKCLYKSSSFP
jgi:hypothetical protein